MWRICGVNTSDVVGLCDSLSGSHISWWDVHAGKLVPARDLAAQHKTTEATGTLRLISWSQTFASWLIILVTKHHNPRSRFLTVLRLFAFWVRVTYKLKHYKKNPRKLSHLKNVLNIFKWNIILWGQTLLRYWLCFSAL